MEFSGLHFQGNTFLVYVCATCLQVPLAEGTIHRNSLIVWPPKLLSTEKWAPNCIDDGCHQTPEIPERKVTDREHNTHGKQLLDLLRSLGLCTLIGRGRDNFTCISSKGSFVVDIV